MVPTVLLAVRAPTRDDLAGVVARVVARVAKAFARTTEDEADGAGRERLLRYTARPAVALDRVSELSDGRIAWRPKQPGGRGETHRFMEPMEFMARLAALVPPPRHPLVRYHGVFAPHSPWRAAVVPGPRPQELERRMKASAATTAAATPAAAAGVASAAGARAATTDAGIWNEGDGGRQAEMTEATRTKAIARGPSRMDWATLLHRVWDVDALKCPRCEGRMKFIATITDRAVIVRILTHLGLPAAEVVAAPARRWDDTS